MTSAVAERTDLSWVTFSGGPADDGCTWHDGTCGLEPVALAYWDRLCCDGAISPDRLCAAHRDEVAAGLRESGPEFECCGCGATVVLLKLEPIR